MDETKTALIVVDMLNDFCEDGSLAVSGGKNISQPIADLMVKSSEQNIPVIMVQDWHPKNHINFSSTHNGIRPEHFNERDHLWPDHCVQGTHGADFVPEVKEVLSLADAIIRKGTTVSLDSHSGFIENDGETETGLGGYLKSRKITKLIIVGLAYDVCVGYTALDAKDMGFDVSIYTSLTASINMKIGDDDSENIMTQKLIDAGVVLL